MPDVHLSLVVPTRNRPDQLSRFLESLHATASNANRFEVVLVVDDDALPASLLPSLKIRQVVGPSGRTMGQLNRAGCEAAQGDFIMLLNDDVIARTPGWDDRLLEAAGRFLDGVVLVHVNDTLMRHHLCVFPLVSRIVCQLMNGICPPEYIRYRIDDHIEDIFTLLAWLGEPRSVYLPEVIFEHTNAVTVKPGVREYHADPAILTLDAPLFDSLRGQRRQAALRLLHHIEAHRARQSQILHQTRLDSAPDPFTLRGVMPQHRSPWIASDGGCRPGVTIVRLTRGSFKSDELAPRTNSDTLVVVSAAAPDLARQLNQILQSSISDYLVILEDGVRLPPGWLEKLLRCMHPGVGAVTPVLRQIVPDRPAIEVAGLVFAPDDSGHHGPWTTPLLGVVPAFSFRSPLVLLDRARAAQVLFDESLGRYFLDCDLGLRFWELGWQCIVTPEVICEVTGNAPYLSPIDEQIFETDRLTFVRHWMGSGRMDRLRSQHWAAIPSLALWLHLASALHQGGQVGVSALASLRHCPILEHYLQPHRPPLQKPSAHPNSSQGVMGQLLRCWRERGFLGFVQAMTRRVSRLLAWAAAMLETPGTPPPNPTRQAAQTLREQ